MASSQYWIASGQQADRRNDGAPMSSRGGNAAVAIQSTIKDLSFGLHDARFNLAPAALIRSKSSERSQVLAAVLSPASMP